MTRADRPAAIFCTISAQADNLGDIVIRQEMIDLVAIPDAEFHISVGSMPPGYIGAFSLPKNAIIHRRASSAGKALVRAALRRRIFVVFPPGPMVLNDARAGLKAWLRVAAVLLARATGGGALTIGVAVRGSFSPALAGERVVAALSHIYASRDSRSSKTLNRAIRRLPDLALADHGPSLHTPKIERKQIAFSLRYDRQVGQDVLRAIGEWARQHGLEVLLVTQVRRDNAQHELMAAEHGWGHLGWTAQSHRQQMQRIENAYGASVLVVTDRLHAALLGLVNGAIPVALTASGEPSKIETTFEGVLPFLQLDRLDPSLVSEILTSVSEDSAGFAQARVEASHEIRSAAAKVREVLAGRGDTRHAKRD